MDRSGSGDNKKRQAAEELPASNKRQAVSALARQWHIGVDEGDEANDGFAGWVMDASEKPVSFQTCPGVVFGSVTRSYGGVHRVQMVFGKVPPSAAAALDEQHVGFVDAMRRARAKITRMVLDEVDKDARSDVAKDLEADRAIVSDGHRLRLELASQRPVRVTSGKTIAEGDFVSAVFNIKVWYRKTGNCAGVKCVLKSLVRHVAGDDEETTALFSTEVVPLV